VVIATPAAAHVSDARSVAAAGLPSIVEKPPALDAAEARLLAALEPTPRIGLNRRFDPSLLDLRARLPEGETLSIRLAFHYRRASWAPRVVTDEALLDLGPHLIDLAYWLSDSPLHSVRTVFRTRDRCTLELELGRARASLSFAADRPYAEVVEVRGANGRLLACRNKGGLARAALGLLRPTSDQLGDSLVGQLEAFCAGVGGGDKGQLASAADGVAVMDAIDAARHSDTIGGAWVDVDATERPQLR
jgi:predicted dehydrogenase